MASQTEQITETDRLALRAIVESAGQPADRRALTLRRIAGALDQTSRQRVNAAIAASMPRIVAAVGAEIVQDWRVALFKVHQDQTWRPPRSLKDCEDRLRETGAAKLSDRDIADAALRHAGGATLRQAASRVGDAERLRDREGEIASMERDTGTWWQRFRATDPASRARARLAEAEAAVEQAEAAHKAAEQAVRESPDYRREVERLTWQRLAAEDERTRLFAWRDKAERQQTAAAVFDDGARAPAAMEQAAEMVEAAEQIAKPSTRSMAEQIAESVRRARQAAMSGAGSVWQDGEAPYVLPAAETEDGLESDF